MSRCRDPDTDTDTDPDGFLLSGCFFFANARVSETGLRTLDAPLTQIRQPCNLYIMTRTQIQLPDALYRRVKTLAEAREVSLAELVRNGLEYILRVSAPPEAASEEWTLPEPLHLGAGDPFADPDWRANLHVGLVAEERISYRAAKRKGRTP